VAAYRERLADVPGLELPWEEADVRRSSHFAFPVLLADRDARDRFRDKLKDDGVQTTWYPALHTFTECRHLAPAGGLPGAEQAAARHCALPLSSTMDETSIEIVVEAVRKALARGG
jgi:dTDP-4-amino-4,6-dideoxygalactose transaminase